MSFTLSQIINDELPVKVTNDRLSVEIANPQDISSVTNIESLKVGGIGDQDYLEKKWVDVPSGNIHTFLNTEEPCAITDLSFFTKNKDTKIIIRLRDHTGSLQNRIRMPTLFTKVVDVGNEITPNNLRDIGGESSLLKEYIYNEDDSEYMFSLKDKMYAPTGLEIKIESSGDEVMGATGQVIYFA